MLSPLRELDTPPTVIYGGTPARVGFICIRIRWREKQRLPAASYVLNSYENIGVILATVAADGNAETEANCLVNMVRSSAGLSAGPHEQIRGLAIEYANIMLTDEWPAMERGEVSPKSHVSIEKLWATVTASETHSGREQTSLDHTFSELAKMTEYRRLRQLQVNSYLPGILWLVLIAGATVTILSACLLGAADVKLHLIQVITLALMISSVLVAIGDINRPFQGSLHVDAAVFERARVAIANRR